MVQVPHRELAIRARIQKVLMGEAHPANAVIGYSYSVNGIVRLLSDRAQGSNRENMGPNRHGGLSA